MGSAHLMFLVQVCWQCLASKGAADISMVYTDVNATAAWRQTIGMAGDPWFERPAFADIDP